MINCGNSNFEISIRNTNYTMFGIHIEFVCTYLLQPDIGGITDRQNQSFNEIQKYFDKVFRSLQEIIPSSREDRDTTSLSTLPFLETVSYLTNITADYESVMHSLLLFEKLANTRSQNIILSETEKNELKRLLFRLHITMSYQIEDERTGCF